MPWLMGDVLDSACAARAMGLNCGQPATVPRRREVVWGAKHGRALRVAGGSSDHAQACGKTSWLLVGRGMEVKAS